MSLVELPKRDGIIEPGQTNIAHIDNLGPRCKGTIAGIYTGGAGKHALTADADTAGSEPGAGPSGRRGVKGGAKDGNIVLAVLGLLVGQCIDVG